MKKLIIPFILLVLILTGCETTYKNWEPPALEVEPMQYYNPEYLTANEPIGKPDWLYAKLDNEGNINFTDGTDPDASYLVLTAEEYKKIKKLLVKYVGTRQLLADQVDLVNSKIDIINATQYRIQLERDLTKNYYELWQNTRQAYKEEKRWHFIDNLTNKGMTALVIIGGVAALAL